MCLKSLLSSAVCLGWGATENKPWRRAEREVVSGPIKVGTWQCKSPCTNQRELRITSPAVSVRWRKWETSERPADISTFLWGRDSRSTAQGRSSPYLCAIPISPPMLEGAGRRPWQPIVACCRRPRQWLAPWRLVMRGLIMFPTSRRKAVRRRWHVKGVSCARPV